MGVLLKGSSPAAPLPVMTAKRPWAAFMLVCLLSGLGMVAVTSLVALNERRSTIEKVKSSNLISAQLITERLAALFRDSEAISAHVVRTTTLNAEGPATDARQEIKDLISRFSELNYAILTDRHGDMLWTTENEQTGSINYADRAYFKTHQAGAEFLIGGPIVGRISGRSLLPVTRAVHDADGGFAGVLFIGIKTEVVEGLFGRFRSHPGVTTTLWRNYGTMMVRYPQAQVVERFPEAPLLQHLAIAPSGTYIAPSVVNGANRISSYSAIGDTSLVVNVSESMDDALAEWRGHVAMMAGLNVLVLGVLLGLARRNIKQTNALVHSGERNRLLLRHASDGVHILDETGTLMDASDSFCRMLGYEREELIGRNVSEWEANFSPAELRETVARQFGSHQTSTFETRHRRKDGTTIDVEVTGLRLDLDGQRVLYNSSRDITERHELESQIRESRDRFATFAEVSSDWFWEMNADLRFSWLSERFADVVDRDPASVIGLRREDVIVDLAPDILERYLEDLRARRPFRNFDYPIDSRSGLKFLRISGVPVFDDDGAFVGYRGTGTNVTALVEAEAQLRESKLAAEAANRAKSAFLANMSHEIRTPMNGIIGMAHLALNDDLPKRQRDRIETIQRSARKLLKIINEILDHSKAEAGKLVVERIAFNLDQLIADAVEMVADAAASKGLDIAVEIAPTVPRGLMGDPLRISQILLNYLNNAIKFTDRGKVTVAVQILEIDDSGALVRFAVADTGIGLTAEQQTTLFQSFQQAETSTARKYGGSGLGLSIAKQLANLMGGTVGAESTFGQGSTFWFSVRLQRSDEDSLPLVEAVGRDGGSQPDFSILEGTRVLLVEDDPTNQMVAVGLLEAVGMVVDIAGDGAVAVAMVGKKDYEVILMDVRMPNMDGITATRLIRQREALAELPIITMTANAMGEHEEECLAAGMNDFISKPLDPRQLYAAIEKWVTGAADAALLGDMVLGPALKGDTQFPSSIQGLDIRAGLRRMAGMKGLYLNTLCNFVENQADAVDHIERSMDAGDIETAGRQAHTLKGLAGMIEASEVAETARQLEVALAEGDIISGQALLQRLGRGLPLLIRSIRSAVMGETIEDAPASSEGDESGADTLVHLAWHSSYECGRDLIDAQHKELLGHANDLLEAVISDRPTGELAELIGTLVHVIGQHFEAECATFSAAGFPSAEEHIKLHRDLLDHAAKLVAHYHAKTLGIGELLQFIAQDVIARHMLGADRAFFPYTLTP